MIRYLKDDFDHEIANKKVLVDFYADWCGPCRMMGELLEKIDEIDILKVNIDKFPMIAKRFGVISIPTLIIFENGTVVKSSVGLMNRDMINKFIE